MKKVTPETLELRLKALKELEQRTREFIDRAEHVVTKQTMPLWNIVWKAKKKEVNREIRDVMRMTA